MKALGLGLFQSPMNQDLYSMVRRGYLSTVFLSLGLIWGWACQSPSSLLQGTADAKSSPQAKGSSQAQVVPSGDVWVEMETNQGSVIFQLYRGKAPLSVANMLAYVASGYYKDTIFHRVIPGFMVQGGGFTAQLQAKPGSLPPIRNEANNGLRNKRGTLAMARTSVVDSATSQFFINLIDNPALDHQGAQQFGYAVLGEVIQGMDVIDRMAKIPRKCPSTSPEPCRDPLLQSKGMRDVPEQPIVIQRMTVLPPP